MPSNNPIRFIISFVFIVAAIINFSNLLAQQAGKADAIYAGLPWYDQNGKVVSAQAANIIKDKSKFYLFGEAHSETSNAFFGFNCYSSTDLYNWKFESIALPVQTTGKLGPNRVGERGIGEKFGRYLYQGTSIYNRFSISYPTEGRIYLTVTVSGLKPNWSDKKKTVYGSTDYNISLDKLIIKE